jgi:choline dehydrogenase-like flavoprotein
MKSTEELPSTELTGKTPEEYDLVVFGGGTGGTIAAWTFANQGQRVLQ